MKYRANVSRILSFVESKYDLKKHAIVRDSKNTYVEVDSIDEAWLLEELNKIEELRIKTAEKFYAIYDANQINGGLDNE